MAKQVRYFVDQSDHDELLRFAEERGFRIVPQLIASDTVAQAYPPTQYGSRAERDEAFVYLIPKEFTAAEAFYCELPGERGTSKLLSHTSPVIELFPTRVESDSPVEGRIYFDDDPGDPRYRLALKGFNEVARYIRRWRKTTNGQFYVGPHSAKRVNCGEVHLVHWGKMLAIEGGKGDAALC